MNRRGMLTGSALFAAGAAGVLGARMTKDALTANDPLPLYTGPAAAVHADRKTAPTHRTVDVHWGVNTSKQLVALTFDDGPMPKWTPEVLATLEERRTPATFFMVGKNAADNHALVDGRLARHEVGNHTWAHQDLAKTDYQGARGAIEQAHRTLAAIAGRDPVLLRPPYGHLSGSAMLAAADLGYHMVLWNLQMLESDYVGDPPGLVDYIVNTTSPGTIMLAHDTGKDDRRVALQGLPQMIDGLRQRGFEFVTVSQLLAEAPAAP